MAKLYSVCVLCLSTFLVFQDSEREREREREEGRRGCAFPPFIKRERGRKGEEVVHFPLL